MANRSVRMRATKNKQKPLQKPKTN